MVNLARAAFLIVAFLAIAIHPGRADDSRPLYIEMTETAPGRLIVKWKAPPNVEAKHLPDLRFPEDCRVSPRARQWSDPLGHWREAEWTCARPLAGQTIAIGYPFANPNLATIARLRLLSGEHTLVRSPQESALTVPESVAPSAAFPRYAKLGFEHIWLGFDHLLFVAGLIFVAGSIRRILVTITGFTITHSATLALAALDLVRLPPSAVEAVIALSIMFLAVEIVKGPRDTLTWRRPVAVAGSFGLLHGFGFAAVLGEIGLPSGNLLLGLLGFNLGIEAGQILFALLLIGLFALLRRLGERFALAIRGKALAGYAVGSLAGYWMVARLVG